MSDPSKKLALRIHDEVGLDTLRIRTTTGPPVCKNCHLSGSWLTHLVMQCNGSDVFGSDICTCRPYLIFGIEEAVKEAQNGGSGVVIYFRKEGRALGEVTKVRAGKRG
jgi:GTP cyclohydrolase II